MAKWGRRKRVAIPEESRFDRMTTADLFMSLEAAVGESGHLVTQYHNQPSQQEPTLAELQIQLETALACAKSLRRRHVVIPPNV
jgi:hypothetical protein